MKNDYDFGNYLYELRRQAQLTQAELADRLGVTDKAVSKWENGRAKPGTELLRRLSALYGISVEELLAKREETKTMEITKIVLTGGPCAGKTTAMTRIYEHFENRGYKVLIIPETATELINGGVSPKTCGTVLDFQVELAKLQLAKEAAFENAAKTMNAAKILIVCDRGIMDGKAYLDPVDYAAWRQKLGASEVDLRDNYDAVFHLVTAAKGAAEAYTLSNNAARTETVEEATVLDDKVIAVWTGHPHLRVIDNSTDFEDKLRRLLAEIDGFLGEPEPFEIERKFLIAYPDIRWLETYPSCRKVEIIQTYLNAPEGGERRVRQRGSDGSFIYVETVKKPISDIKRVETERRLTQSEYLNCLLDADMTRHPIRKTRYCLTWENQYFEIDVYPFWDDKAIVEIELQKEDTPVHFPKELKIIKEVTGDPAYKNAALARNTNV